MELGRYRLLAQIGAGGDGASYRAQVLSRGGLAEIRLLTAVRNQAERWPLLVRRLKLAALLDHPGALRIEKLNLEHDPPYLALEWAAEERLSGLAVPLAVPQALALGQELAEALAAAHRLGLVHGQLDPDAVRGLGPQLQIDFTGTDTYALLASGSAATLSTSWHAPEEAGRGPAAAADVYRLGRLLLWLLGGRGKPADTQRNHGPRLTSLLHSMLRDDAEDRPSAAEVAESLAALLANPEAVAAGNDLALTVNLSVASLPQESAPAEPLTRQSLGRFRLLESLGEGGMGSVYRAEDTSDGSIVALKVLRRQTAASPEALRRLHKEARLLAEVEHPAVANLLEVNEDGGIHYLVLEYVSGPNLGKILQQNGPLDEATALALLTPVVRALAVAHERGVIHRDIKPDNILLVEGDSAAPELRRLGIQAVKLADFGLARHLVESESLQITQAGTVLGTPLYMAPEQCAAGGDIGPPADIYALGVTLFHMLAGHPPYLAPSPLLVMAMHCHEPVPQLEQVNPSVSGAVAQVVARCLAKAPRDRYADADALCRDLERLQRKEAVPGNLHPALPPCDPEQVQRYEFSWELEATPGQLWPHVSNTERLNRAIGMQSVQFSTRADDAGDPELPLPPRRFGKIRKVGLVAAWEEHPFEWIEARRMGVLRVFSDGPFKWMMSVVELAPRPGGGTTLTHRIQIETHGFLGRTVAAVEVGLRAKRALARVYRRIDAAVTGQLAGPADPFEEPAPLSSGRRQRLDRLLEKLSGCGIDATVIERLGDYLALAPTQEAARIRPLALARRLALDADQVVAACLHGTREGLLLLLWDILCPVCRIPSEAVESLRGLKAHGHCDACRLDFELDFANSVEMVFRIHPEIRASDLGTYCVGGPAHSPHVAAQLRVAAGETVELDLELGEGAYRLRGPALPFVCDFAVLPTAAANRWEVPLPGGPDDARPRALRAGRQVITFVNDCNQELVVRVERTAARADALTAARASALDLFRQIFPNEVLSPGQLIRVATVTLLVTDLAGAEGLYAALGDARAFAILHEHFQLVHERIRKEGGALVKTVGEGVLAVFAEPLAAVRAALDLPVGAEGGCRLRGGIHRGAALVATLNDHLDYFGNMVSQALRLPALAAGGEWVLSPEVASDPSVALLLRSRGLEAKVLEADLPGQPGMLLHRVSPGVSQEVPLRSPEPLVKNSGL